MYGFDYELEPATEGIKEAFVNFWKGTWEKIQHLASTLKETIGDLGAKLKRNKNDFPTNDQNAKAIITRLGSKTEAFVKECAKSINTMYTEYGYVGKTQVYSNDNTIATGKSTTSVTTSHVVFDNDDTEFAVMFDPVRGHMKRDKYTSKEDWNDFQNEFGKLFTSMHGDAEDIKKDLIELKSMPPLSYNTTVEGYKQLKDLYDANGKFGREWSQLKTAYAFANVGPIKKALGKIVSMYNVGASAAKAFALRLKFGVFRNDEGKKYALKADDRKQAKDEVKNNKFAEAKRVNKKSGYSAASFDKHGQYNSLEEIYDKISENEKKHHPEWDSIEVEITDESAMLSKLYDIAYEDAMHDFEMKAEYIRVFESVPDAFDEFDI